MSDTVINKQKDVLDELKESMERNRELLEKVYDSTEKTRNYLKWIRIMNFAKIVLVAIMVGFGLLFLGDQLSVLKDAYGL